MSDPGHSGAEVVLLAFEVGPYALALAAEDVQQVCPVAETADTDARTDLAVVCEIDADAAWAFETRHGRLVTPEPARLAYLPADAFVEVPDMLEQSARQLGLARAYWDDDAGAFRWLLDPALLTTANEEAA